MAASEYISCFLKNRRLLLKDTIEQLLVLKESVQLMFFVCVTAKRSIPLFFNERAAGSEKIFNDCF